MLNRIRDVIPPQNMTQLMGSRGQVGNSTSMRSRSRRQPDNASPAKLFVTEACTGNTSNHGCRDLVSSGCSQLRVRQWQREQREHHEQQPAPFATAPLAIHNHKAIFGWAANLFLAAATSQTTTAEKSGPPGLGDPVPGRGDVEGTADCAPPSPCRMLPTSHIPPGAWPGPAQPGVPSPSQRRQPVSQSVFIYLHHPPLPVCLCPTSALSSLILSLPTSLTTSQ